MITSLTSWSDHKLIFSTNTFVTEKYESEILGLLGYVHWIWIKIAISVSGPLELSKYLIRLIDSMVKKLTILTTMY